MQIEYLNFIFVNFHDGREQVGFDFWGPWNVMLVAIEGGPLPLL